MFILLIDSLGYLNQQDWVANSEMGMAKSNCRLQLG